MAHQGQVIYRRLNTQAAEGREVVTFCYGLNVPSLLTSETFQIVKKPR